jgi:hypothetical protein
MEAHSEPLSLPWTHGGSTWILEITLWSYVGQAWSYVCTVRPGAVEALLVHCEQYVIAERKSCYIYVVCTTGRNPYNIQLCKYIIAERNHAIICSVCTTCRNPYIIQLNIQLHRESHAT